MDATNNCSRYVVNEMITFTKLYLLTLMKFFNFMEHKALSQCTSDFYCDVHPISTVSICLISPHKQVMWLLHFNAFHAMEHVFDAQIFHPIHHRIEWNLHFICEACALSAWNVGYPAFKGTRLIPRHQRQRFIDTRTESNMIKNTYPNLINIRDNLHLISR